MKIIFNKLFYITFLIWVIVFYTSASFLNIWLIKKWISNFENYERTDILDDAIIDLIFIWIWNFNINYTADRIIIESIKYLKEMDHLVKLDIINYVKTSTRPWIVLENFLIRTNKVIWQYSLYKSNLENLISEYKIKSDICSREKKVSDVNFFWALRVFDTDILYSSLKASSERSACYEEYRVLKNWTEIILNLINNRYSLIKEKYWLLETSKEMIIQNISLFENSNIEKLYDIKQKINDFNLSITNF